MSAILLIALESFPYTNIIPMIPHPLLNLPIRVKVRVFRLLLVQRARFRWLGSFLIRTRHPGIINRSREACSFLIRAIDREWGLNTFQTCFTGYSTEHTAGVRDADGLGAAAALVVSTGGSESCDGAFVVVLAVEVGMLTFRAAAAGRLLDFCALGFCEVVGSYWGGLIDRAIDVIGSGICGLRDGVVRFVAAGSEAYASLGVRSWRLRWQASW